MAILAYTRLLRSLRPFFCRRVSWISSYDVRDKFIKFYETNHNHKFIPSSPVRLSEDDSLMFVNAGMNQFKPKFLGTNEPSDWLSDLKRVVNSQKCIRVGGKHNDLNDVGKDTSHHTFFEMLGSWSFGDYFKHEACEMALTLLTEHYGITIDQLYFTYFAGSNDIERDTATRDIWKSLGIPENRIIAFGSNDNFWEMGDTGPCGPCTEIHYDYTTKHSNSAELVNTGHPDVVEIWNLVFMQFNRLQNGSLLPLPTHHVDTGMGFERLVAILQDKRSNYDTDLFSPIIKEMEYICEDSLRYKGSLSLIDQAYRTIADHIRMLVIAIGDKVYPGNTKEELIVRQVLRRAYLQSKKHLQAPDFLFKALCPLVISSLGQHFSYLYQNQSHIIKVIDQEVSNFANILSKGETMFFNTMAKMKDKRFPVETALLLHNHFGYPIDLLVEITQNHRLHFDLDRFQEHQEERKLSKEKDPPKPKRINSFPITSNILETLRAQNIPVTNSDYKYNYEKSESDEYTFFPIRSKILAIIDSDGNILGETADSKQCALVLDQTCFYYTDGGQISDTGTIQNDCDSQFCVDDVTNIGGFVFHFGHGGGFSTNDRVDLTIDHGRRLGCMRAHTATHLLNHALREVLGEICQNGSRVAPDEVRFTFLGPTPSHDNLKHVLSIIQENISEDFPVKIYEQSLNDALSDSNTRRLNDCMYSDPARVVATGSPEDKNNSVELCGGTHVLSTGDIEEFEIISSKSQGKHKTTLQCLTSNLATKSKLISIGLQSQVEENVSTSSKILSSSDATVEDCAEIRKDIGRTNYKVNQSEICVVVKAELKEILRKHSQMLGTKIRNLKKKEIDAATVRK